MDFEFPKSNLNARKTYGGLPSSGDERVFEGNVRMLGQMSNVCFQPLFVYFPHSEEWQNDVFELVSTDVRERMRAAFDVTDNVHWVRNHTGQWTLFFTDHVITAPMRKILATLLRGRPAAGIPLRRKLAYIDVMAMLYGTHPNCLFTPRDEMKRLLLSETFLMDLRCAVLDGRYPPQVLRVFPGWASEQLHLPLYHHMESAFHVFSAQCNPREVTDHPCAVRIHEGNVLLEQHMAFRNISSRCRAMVIRLEADRVRYDFYSCSWSSACPNRLEREPTKAKPHCHCVSLLAPESSAQSDFLNSSFLSAYLGCSVPSFPVVLDEKPHQEELCANELEQVRRLQAKEYTVKFLQPAVLPEDPFERMEKGVVEYFRPERVSLAEPRPFLCGITERFLPYQGETDTNKHVYMVSGSCGCGKTTFAKSVVQYAFEHGKTLLYISPRISQLKDFYKEIRRDRVAYYTDSDEVIRNSLVFCCCYHSLGKKIKIDQFNVFDMVIFDEVLTSELCDFSSDFLRDKERLENKISWLMASCSKLFLLDSELNPFVTLFMASLGRIKYAREDLFFADVRRYLNMQDIVVHRMKNEINPVEQQDRVQMVLFQRELLMLEMMEALRAGKRIALFVSNKGDIDSVMAVLVSFLSQAFVDRLHTKVITSDGGIPPEETIGEFLDRTQCKLLIFSSKISVGTSVDCVFDSMFCLISSDHVTALALRQALERVRTYDCAYVCFTTQHALTETELLQSKAAMSIEKLATLVYQSSRDNRTALKWNVYDQPRKDAMSMCGLMKNALHGIRNVKGLWATLYIAFSANFSYRNRTYFLSADEVQWSEEVLKIWDTHQIMSQMQERWGDKRVLCSWTEMMLDQNACVGIPIEVRGKQVTLLPNLSFYDYGAMCATFQTVAEYAEWKEAVDCLHELGLNVLFDPPAPKPVAGETEAEYRRRYAGLHPSSITWRDKMFTKNKLEPFDLCHLESVPAVASLPESVPNLYENLLLLRLYHAQLSITDPEQLKDLCIAEKMILIPRLETWREFARLSQALKILHRRRGFPLIERSEEEEEDNPFDWLQQSEWHKKKTPELFREVFGFSIKEKNVYRALFALYNRHRFQRVLPEWPEAAQVDDGYIDRLVRQHEQVVRRELSSQDLVLFETLRDSAKVDKLKRKYNETLSVLSEDEAGAGDDSFRYAPVRRTDRDETAAAGSDSRGEEDDPESDTESSASGAGSGSDGGYGPDEIFV